MIRPCLQANFTRTKTKCCTVCEHSSINDYRHKTEVSNVQHKYETCFSVVGSPPNGTTSSTPFCNVDMKNSKYFNHIKYSVPHHSYETIDSNVFTSVHIPKETSLSSAVAFGESSELSADISGTVDTYSVKEEDPRVCVQDCNLKYTDSASSLAGKNDQIFVPEKDYQSDNIIFTDDNTKYEITQGQFCSKSTQTDHSVSCPCPCSFTIQRISGR